MLRHQLEQTVQVLFSVSTLADRTGAFLGNTLGQSLPSLVHRPTFIMRLVFPQQEIQQFPVNGCLIDRVKNWALGLGNSLLLSGLSPTEGPGHQRTPFGFNRRRFGFNRTMFWCRFVWPFASLGTRIGPTSGPLWSSGSFGPGRQIQDPVLVGISPR